MNEIDRRAFLKFLGVSGYALTNISLFSALTSCQSPSVLDFKGISPTRKDDLVLADGLKYKTIISYGDKINNKEIFGFNNDYITYEAINKNELLMWVNHEYVNPILVAGKARTQANIDKEREIIGGSIIKVKRKSANDSWEFDPNSKYNKGVRATTKIPFNNGVKIMGQDFAIGTIANCAGGKTPWGTFLSCEENYQHFYGKRDYKTKEIKSSYQKWETIYPNPPEHYGWVVEINPFTAHSKKHTTLGRFSHECATCITAKAGNVVVYTADDKGNEHIYKFISESADSFDKGILYVANTDTGKWLPLDLEKSPILKQHFKNQLDVMIHTRAAAKVLGATPLDRPEDIEIHPLTGDIYITLTNNKKKGNFHGSILKLSERNGDYNAKSFQTEIFLFGGEQNKFSCPDNLAFDNNGNLWICSDISGRAIGDDPYRAFGNNGLFVVATKGSQAGIPIQVASAPIDAELTGLSFSPDYKTLFLSVQHPGEGTKDINHPTSHWPAGTKDSIPKSSVVAITGDLLESITQ